MSTKMWPPKSARLAGFEAPDFGEKPTWRNYLDLDILFLFVEIATWGPTWDFIQIVKTDKCQPQDSWVFKMVDGNNFPCNQIFLVIQTSKLQMQLSPQKKGSTKALSHPSILPFIYSIHLSSYLCKLNKISSYITFPPPVTFNGRKKNETRRKTPPKTKGGFQK